MPLQYLPSVSDLYSGGANTGGLIYLLCAQSAARLASPLLRDLSKPVRPVDSQEARDC